MVKSLPIHDLEGRDVQAPSNTGEHDSDTTTTIPSGGRGRILLSMVNSDGAAYHAAIVLPTTYLEAKAMAVDAFHAEITDAGMDVTDLVLKLGMKSLAYETTWALLRPEQWTDIVRDGDEIRLGRRGGAEVVDLYGPGPLVTFKHLIGYNTGKIYKYVTMLLPKTCEELDTIIRSEFELSRRDKFDLARVLGDGVKVAQIPPVQWLTVIRQLVKENPSREILVERR